MSNPYQAPASDLNAVRAVCEEYGFCLVKNVLKPEDLEKLLAGMKAETAAAGDQPLADLLALPALRHIYFDPRLLKIATALLGPKLIYDGEGNVNFEESIGAYTLNPYAELHCDARGMPEDIKAHWRSPSDAIYRAYRFGIYFNDYTTASGALKVIVGSHRGDPAAYNDKRLLSAGVAHRVVGTQQLAYPATTFPLHNVPCQPGDVVIWNLRTFHSAGAKLFVGDPSLAVHPQVEEKMAQQAPDLFAPPPGPRNALFFDYAAPAEDIDLYIKLRSRPTTAGFAARLVRKSDDPASLQVAEEHGVGVRQDTLITTLAAVLATNHSANPIQPLDAEKTRAVRARLHKLLAAHVEYSPYFPLFNRAAFDSAPSIDAAIDSAVRDILANLQAPKKS